MFQKQFSPKISFTITGVVEVFIRSKPSCWLFTENSWWKKNKFSIEPDKEGELIYLWHLNPLPPLFLLQPLSQMWLQTRFNDQHITLVQAVAWRQPKAENLRSSRAFQFLFYLMSRYGIFKNIFIFVGIGRSNEHGKR